MSAVSKRAYVTAVALILGMQCQAATLVSLGPADPPRTTSSGYPLSNVLAASWTSTAAFQNVAVSAWLGTASGFTNPTLEAYITTQIGPGSLPSSGIVSSQTQVSLVNNAWTEVLLFSNLTLPAGTYYLVLYDTGGSTDWGGCAGTCSASLGPNISLNADQAAFVGPLYRPASSFGSANQSAYSYRLTGDPVTSGVPEPATLLLLAPAIALIVGHSRRT